MPWPHGKDEDAVALRPLVILEVTGACDPHVPVSAEGVDGCEVVGDIELLANEFLRPGWLSGPILGSFSQDARRTGGFTG